MVLAATAAAVAVGSWSKAPSLGVARSAHAVVALDGSAYALGGSGTGGTPLAVERFDGTRWTVDARLPGDGLNAPAAVALGGQIYLIGGFEGTTNLPMSAVEVYDPSARTWSSAAPLPAPRGGHAAVVVDGKIHVLGGGNSVSTLADHSVYDPASGTWTEAAPLPRAEGSPAAVVFGGRIYAIGGRSGFSDFGDVYVYDPARDAWSRGPSIPPRGTAGAVVYRGAIYVFGGESQATGRTLADVFRLTRGAKAWRRVGAMPTARSYARAVVVHDAVYVVGGSRSAGSSHSAAGSRIVERYFVRKP
jgi:N-acetylneuraminic acid mutarotase